ncbi:MAG: peptide chain release factor N(5)-glutamine methyltransferase [Dehalococcoidia bacterium]|nr:peptide chain release factor N(5)-glutamine methyltransferase [Dehalococcoidia bacterium]
MIIKEELHQSSKTLAARSIEDAPLEAELLLMHLLGIDRAKLYARLEDELSPGDAQAFAHLINRRLWGEPIAYIIGHREFFGHDFHVAPGVLIPRPESELLVEEALDFVFSNFSRSSKVLTDEKSSTPEEVEKIAEIGTGSGAIAISLALLLPKANIYATDICPRALEIAAINREKHGVINQVYLLEGDLLAPLPEPVDLILANLPYIKDEDLRELSAEVRMFEPMVALAGGGDGLDKVRQLLEGVGEKLRPGGLLLLEIGAGQGQAAASLVKSLYPGARVELAQDLSGRERVMRVMLT